CGRCESCSEWASPCAVGGWPRADVTAERRIYSELIDRRPSASSANGSERSCHPPGRALPHLLKSRKTLLGQSLRCDHLIVRSLRFVESGCRPRIRLGLVCPCLVPLPTVAPQVGGERSRRPGERLSLLHFSVEVPR